MRCVCVWRGGGGGMGRQNVGIFGGSILGTDGFEDLSHVRHHLQLDKNRRQRQKTKTKTKTKGVVFGVGFI